MKKLTKWVLAALLSLCSAFTSAEPLIPALVSVSENEAGTLTFSGSDPLPLPFVLRADLSPGGLASVPFFSLLGPPSLVLGDVLILETVGGPISDVLRFAISNDEFGFAEFGFFFYSDVGVGDTAAADVGLPTQFSANAVSLSESTFAFGIGIDYTPTAGQPGFVDGFLVQYQVKSDSDNSVPEPGTLMLVGATLASFALVRRKKQV